MDVIGKRKIYLGVSGILVLVSWGLIIFLGLRPGIDLVGGTAWQIAFFKEVSSGDVKGLFQKEFDLDISVKEAGDGSFILRLPETNEKEHRIYLETLEKEFGKLNELNFSSIGPTIGSELRRKAAWAVILVLIFISLFIAWAFRKVSEPIKSWKYGVVTLVTLLHDVSIPTGMLAILGFYLSIEIDTNFIVALLVVMGFSVHDTIVVFDRIREELLINRERKLPLDYVINESIRRTLARSLNTSLTLIFILLALIFIGPPSLFYFVLTILFGTIVGTYSSIFVASPLLYVWRGSSAISSS